MSELVVASTLSVQTDTGESKIQILVGDITKLPKSDEVDVLVISAFPGDYSATPTSVVGALLRNNGVNVRNISKDKEEDLRKLYYCWWSRPLDPSLSYRRILCFEPSFGLTRQHPGQLVGDVFRCLVPVLTNNEGRDGKVIMPLLASGDQGYSKRKMMYELTKAAVKWIKAGLPLKELKIVIYSRTPESWNKDIKGKVEYFDEIKKHFEEEELQEKKKAKKKEDEQIKYDLYLSSSINNNKYASTMLEVLKSEKESIAVFAKKQEMNDEEGWQDEMFNVMVTCARVVALLSPSYLDCVSCTEQYNMALCCSKKKHSDVLAPLYLETIDNLPTYMGLIQYTDCRPYDRTKMVAASKQILSWLELHQSQIHRNPDIAALKTSPPKYDIFISYCHANDEHAYRVLEELKRKNSQLKVFIDTSELKIGNTWQLALYEAIEGSKCLVALLSPEYAASKVCQEEFALSLALQRSSQSELHLVSMIMEPIENLPVGFTEPIAVDCTDKQSGVLERVCESVVHLLTGEEEEKELSQRSRDLQLNKRSCDEIFAQLRKLTYLNSIEANNSPQNDKDEIEDKTQGVTSVELLRKDGTMTEGNGNTTVNAQESIVCDIALSFAHEDKDFAITFEKMLLHENPDLKIHKSEDDSHSARMNFLDTAKVIVPFLSPSYILNQDHVNELQISLCRHRWSDNFLCFPIHVGALPFNPSYAHLIPIQFSMRDEFWSQAFARDYPTIRGLRESLGILSEVNEIVSCCLYEAAKSLLKQMQTGVNQGIFKKVLLNVKEVELICDEIVKQNQERSVHIQADQATKEGVEQSSPLDETKASSLDETNPSPPDDSKASPLTEKAPSPPVEEDRVDHWSNIRIDHPDVTQQHSYGKARTKACQIV